MIMLNLLDNMSNTTYCDYKADYERRYGNE